MIAPMSPESPENPGPRGLVVAVSTIRDTHANLRRYVTRNLAGGVDHLVVFTEETGPDGEAYLDAHPHVTHVPTGRGWWGEERSEDLNVRQRTAANLARVLLAPFGWAEWLVHIDGDEVVVLDRDVVDGAAPEVKVLRLDVLEAVSRAAWPDGEVTHFKRLLARPELVLLSTLGLVAEPDNKAYFHGHVRGKRGVRLRTDLRIGLHTVKNGKGSFVKGYADPGLRMLHLDSATAEEFVRKWTTLAQAGSRAVYRRSRIPVVNSLRTLAGMDLTDEVRQRYLHRIYDLTTAEDFDTLRDLGLLEEVAPDGGSHTPVAAPVADLERLAALLTAAAGHSRAGCSLDDPWGGYDLLGTLLTETGQPAGPAVQILGYVGAKVARWEADPSLVPPRARGEEEESDSDEQ